MKEFLFRLYTGWLVSDPLYAKQKFVPSTTRKHTKTP